MKILKQSTATTLLLGPFVDETDGKTAETGLTISQADVLLWKEGGTTLAQKNEATSCTHRSNGLYTCPLNTTDTNTLGILTVSVHESGALPVRHDFYVVPAAVFDSLVSGTGNGPRVDVAAISGDSAAADNLEAYSDGTTPQPVNVTQVSGDSGAADNLEAAYDGTGYAHTGNTYPWTAAWDAEVQSEVQDAIEANHLDHLLATDYDPAAKPGVATALLNEIVESDGGVSRFTANALEQGPGGTAADVLTTGTAQAGSANTITLAAGESVTNDLFNLAGIRIVSGTGAGQSRQIIDYVGATKIATVNEAWAENPDNTSVYEVVSNGLQAATLTDIKGAVWDAQRVDHQLNGSFGERVLADMTHLSGNATAADNAESVFLTAPGALAVDVAFVNGVEVIGDGTDSSPWRALGT